MKVDELRLQAPNHLGLSFSPGELERSRSKAGEYSHDAARWNAYLNRLCLNSLVPWLEEESGDRATVWPGTSDLASIWEFVNGTAITLNKTRIVLIPSDAIGIEEFCVPKEWIDIPSWRANYYLAVQIDPDDSWLRVWGYATHQMLKNRGIYNEFEGVYSLKREDVIEDLNAMWVARDFCPDEREEIPPLPSLSLERAETLLAQLSQPSPYSPRLDVEFERWAALLENNAWRRQLYERRLRQLAVPVVGEKKLANLTGWLQNRFERGWQTIEEVFGTGEASLAVAFRNRELQPENPEAIKNLIDSIYTSSEEDRLAIAAYRLGECGSGNPDAVAALIHLLRTTKDEEIRWTAAESLWLIDPENPAAGVKRFMNLGMRLAGYAVVLMLAVLEKSDQKMAILLRLYSMESKIAYLPPGLQLIVRDEAGNAVLEARSREADNYIQLKFGGSRGERFTVGAALGDAGITEDFVI